MDLRQLRYVLEVVRQSGFARAARALHVAQPAVSVAVRKLEAELGVALLERSVRGAALTLEGKAFVSRAEAIERELRDLETEMKELCGLEHGQVRIGIPSMLAAYALPAAIGAFRRRYPGLRLSVYSGGARRIQAMIAAGELDVGIVSRQGALDALVFRPLLRDEMVACVARDHHLAGRRSVRLEELAAEPLCLFREEYFQRAVLDEAFAALHLQPKVVLEANLVSLLVDAVSRGEGVTTLLRMAAEAERAVVPLSFKPRLHVEAGVAWRAGAYLSRASRAFVDFLVQEAFPRGRATG